MTKEAADVNYLMLHKSLIRSLHPDNRPVKWPYTTIANNRVNLFGRKHRVRQQ